MKPAFALLIFMLAAPLSVAGQRTHLETLEFSGYLKTSERLLFIVTNLQTKKASNWLRVGDSFEGYAVSGYDEKSEILTLQGVDTMIRLSLKPSQVVRGQSESREFRFAISSDGKVTMDGQLFTREQLEAMFRLAAKEGTEKVALIIQEPGYDGRDGSQFRGALVDILRALIAAGLKRSSLKREAGSGTATTGR